MGRRSLALAIVAITLLAPLAGAGRAAAAESVGGNGSIHPRYFPETGHYLSGRFRQYWESKGGLAVFGYPLTKVFPEAGADNVKRPTQYFERARFEWHAEMPQPYDVMLTLLGHEMTLDRRGEAPFRPAVDREDCEGLAQPTAHNVCGAFYRFWLSKGGLSNFGYPLSEAFDEVSQQDGRTYTVQYFERGRWEYHPEYAGTEGEVLLGLLGLERLERTTLPLGVREVEAQPPTLWEMPYGMAPFPTRVAHLQFGINTYLIGSPGGEAYNDRALGMVRDAGLGWVRLQLVWRDFEPSPGQYDWAPLDAKINAAAASGAKILLSIAKSPAWAAPSRPGGVPEDTAAFGRTMQMLTGHYRGLIQAYEIWNEPNLASEAGGWVDANAYVAALKAAWDGVKSVDGAAVILVGGLLTTTHNDPAVAVDDTVYLRQIYEAGAREFFDALAVHPYGAANPPEALYPEHPGPGSCPVTFATQEGNCYRDSRAYYFRRVEDLRAIMDRNHDLKKQIWITEFGWSSCEGLPVPAGYEYCTLISEQQQADYTVRAFDYANRHWPWLGAIFLWNLNYAAIPGIPQDEEKVGWSVVRADWSPRPVYEAVRTMPKLPILPPNCGQGLIPAC
jgi:hypothetical protein